MGREANHLFQSGVEVMCDSDFISTSHLSSRLHVVLNGDFTFTLLLLRCNTSSRY